MNNLDLKGIPQTIIDFIEKHKDLQITVEEFIENHSNELGIHNHTLENLFLYFDLEKHLTKKRVVFYPGVCFIVDNRKHKFFVDETFTDFLVLFDFSEIEVELHKKIIIYSAKEQDANPLFVKSKLKEAEYLLDEVFDEKTYHKKYEGRKQSDIKKKIYNKIIYPFRYLASKGEFRVEDITSKHLEEVETMHKNWVEFKRNDPKVFQMMFSSNRYNRCIKMMFESNFLQRDNFFAKIFYWNDRPIAIRQCLIKDSNSFDIGFFSEFWRDDVPSNLIFYINMWCLKELKEQYNVKRHDTGMLLDKNLEMSKNHIPAHSVLCWKYNFSK